VLISLYEKIKMGVLVNFSTLLGCFFRCLDNEFDVSKWWDIIYMDKTKQGYITP